MMTPADKIKQLLDDAQLRGQAPLVNDRSALKNSAQINVRGRRVEIRFKFRFDCWIGHSFYAKNVLDRSRLHDELLRALAA